MKADWVDICLDTNEYKDTGAHMLRGIDEVQAVLDDHIVKTQGIRSSPFCKPFEQEVHEWEAKMLYIQDFVDQTLLAAHMDAVGADLHFGRHQAAVAHRVPGLRQD